MPVETIAITCAVIYRRWRSILRDARSDEITRFPRGSAARDCGQTANSPSAPQRPVTTLAGVVQRDIRRNSGRSRHCLDRDGIRRRTGFIHAELPGCRSDLIGYGILSMNPCGPSHQDKQTDKRHPCQHTQCTAHEHSPRRAPARSENSGSEIMCKPLKKTQIGARSSHLSAHLATACSLAAGSGNGDRATGSSGRLRKHHLTNRSNPSPVRVGPHAAGRAVRVREPLNTLCFSRHSRAGGSPVPLSSRA